MRKFSNQPLMIFSQIGSMALYSKKTLCLSAFFFFTGISTGIFLELTMGTADKGSLSGYLQQYLFMDTGAVEYPNPFLSSLTSNLLLLLIMFLGGLSVFGFPAALAALAYKGTALGFCTGLIAETLKNKGILVILTSLLPQNLLLIPAFILGSAAALNYSFLSMGKRRMAAKRNLRELSGSYVLTMVVFAVIMALACGLEAILYPVVLLP